MSFVAIKILIGDRAKYLGIIMGLTFASLLITQQAAIFVGLMTRTYGFVTDSGLADLWVMDPKVQFIDDIKPLQDTQLLRVRGVEGVEWAVPLYKGLLKARLDNGNFQTCNIIGLDDATLIGGPPAMIAGQTFYNFTLDNLRHFGALMESVTDKRAISVDELNRRRFAVQVAEAKLPEARAQLALLKAGSWKADIDIAKAEVAAAQAQVGAIETDVERLTVHAPVDGQVLQVKVRVGEFAQTGVLATPLKAGDTIEGGHS